LARMPAATATPFQVSGTVRSARPKVSAPRRRLN